MPNTWNKADGSCSVQWFVFRIHSVCTYKINCIYQALSAQERLGMLREKGRLKRREEKSIEKPRVRIAAEEATTMAMAFLCTPTALLASSATFRTGVTHCPTASSSATSVAVPLKSSYPDIVCGRGDKRMAKGKRARAPSGTPAPRMRQRGPGWPWRRCRPGPRRRTSSRTASTSMLTLTKPSLLLAEVVLSDIYINCVIVAPEFRAACMVYKPYYIHSLKIVPRPPFYFELWWVCDIWNFFGGILLFVILEDGEYIHVDIDETLFASSWIGILWHQLCYDFQTPGFKAPYIHSWKIFPWAPFTSIFGEHVTFWLFWFFFACIYLPDATILLLRGNWWYFKLPDY